MSAKPDGHTGFSGGSRNFFLGGAKNLKKKKLYGEREARAYKGVWGQSLQWGTGAKPLFVERFLVIWLKMSTKIDPITLIDEQFNRLKRQKVGWRIGYVYNIASEAREKNFFRNGMNKFCGRVDVWGGMARWPPSLDPPLTGFWPGYDLYAFILWTILHSVLEKVLTQLKL